MIMNSRFVIAITELCSLEPQCFTCHGTETADDPTTFVTSAFEFIANRADGVFTLLS